MKKSLLYIYLLFLFLGTAFATQEFNETPKKVDDIPFPNNHNIEYGFISADSQSGQAYDANKYIACKISLIHRSEGHTIELSSPFIINEHPSSITNILFFRAFLLYEDKYPYIPQKGELLVDTIEKNPVWCFENNEKRNLNYKVYLAPFYHQMEPSLKHILKTDFFIFSPYFEKNGESYILTWNPIDTVQNSVKADKRIILFPFSGEQGSRPGVIISPLLFYNFNGNCVYIAGHIRDYSILATLVYKVKDEQGTIWILSWRKVDKQTLHEHSSFYTHM